MSDTWYRDPPSLPPFEDGSGKLRTLDELKAPPPPLPDEFRWLEEWPEDLRFTALNAAVNMQMREDYERMLRQQLDGEWIGE